MLPPIICGTFGCRSERIRRSPRVTSEGPHLAGVGGEEAVLHPTGHVPAGAGRLVPHGGVRGGEGLQHRPLAAVRGVRRAPRANQHAPPGVLGAGASPRLRPKSKSVRTLR
eukprot:1196311-Prorocentrum_minimum.AAC.5